MLLYSNSLLWGMSQQQISVVKLYVYVSDISILLLISTDVSLNVLPPSVSTAVSKFGNTGEGCSQTAEVGKNTIYSDLVIVVYLYSLSSFVYNSL